MRLVNTGYIAQEKVVETLAMVRGSTVQSKHLGRDFMAGLKSLVGGELRGYTELLEEARDEALARMVAEAERLGADAVVNIRFVTSSIAANASEILVFGTAVRTE